MISLKKRAAALLLICLAALSLLPSAALAAGDVKLDEEHFPDTGFREYLSQSIFDTNEDGILSESEIGAIKKINVSKKGIARLDGLEYLTALEYLSCSQNLLTALDVSKNTGLRVLDVNGNQLTKLDVSKNPGLRNLTAEDNQLTALDLSKNPELGLLACDGNKLTALDVTPCPKLVNLNCAQNQLTALDVSGCPELIYLKCSQNKIALLDISGNPKLLKTYNEGTKSEDAERGIVQYDLDDNEEDGHLTLCVDSGTRIRVTRIKTPKITLQPKSKTVKAGKKVTFKVKATGGELKYQWYVKKAGSKKWTKIKKATKPVYSFKVRRKLDGYRYRCRVYNGAGYKYSRTVKLKVKK